MPIYEYECTKCGHRFELIQKMSARRVRTCPECKGKVERLANAPAIQFKGTGWYVTDYAGKSGGDTKSPTSDSKSSGKSESKSGAKSSDSKNSGAKGSDSKSSDSKSSPEKSSDS
jgi:putative FmdB family regulatory protein